MQAKVTGIKKLLAQFKKKLTNAKKQVAKLWRAICVCYRPKQLCRLSCNQLLLFVHSKTVAPRPPHLSVFVLAVPRLRYIVVYAIWYINTRHNMPTL